MELSSWEGRRGVGVFCVSARALARESGECQKRSAGVPDLSKTFTNFKLMIP